jgi:hypothetical protein
LQLITKNTGKKKNQSDLAAESTIKEWLILNRFTTIESDELVDTEYRTRQVAKVPCLKEDFSSNKKRYNNMEASLRKFHIYRNKQKTHANGHLSTSGS